MASSNIELIELLGIGEIHDDHIVFIHKASPEIGNKIKNPSNEKLCFIFYYNTKNNTDISFGKIMAYDGTMTCNLSLKTWDAPHMQLGRYKKVYASEWVICNKEMKNILDKNINKEYWE